MSAPIKKAIRENLMVSVDDRLTGEQEVLVIKTTSGQNISIQLPEMTTKVSFHPDDLVEALEKIKEFIKARPPQPKITQPIGVNTPVDFTVEHTEDFGN